ncbi:MAG: L,D-transpeptidase family protein, partial [Candidatus Udaeobacter sp.]
MRISTLIRLVLLGAVVSSASGQFHLGPKPRQTAPTPPPMRKASDLIRRQEALKVNQSLLKQATQDNTRIVVSIPKQRAYLMIGDQIVADGPVSSGRRGHETPHGHFSVMEKDPNHHSSLYGDFVDGSGRTVR